MRRKFYSYCEVVFLGAAVFVTIGLFSIPTVYFAIIEHEVSAISVNQEIFIKGFFLYSSFSWVFCTENF